MQPYDLVTVWALYEIALAQFLAANNIKPAASYSTDIYTSVPTFLLQLSIVRFQLFEAFGAPAALDTKTIDQLKKVLFNHFYIAASTSLALHNFNRAKTALFRDSRAAD